MRSMLSAALLIASLATLASALAADGLTALAWQDASGQVWLGYNDPRFLAARHGVPNCAVAPNLSKALEGLAAEATRP
jgi:hypothetical protein